jgi:catechol 2,3-dioxygenase-like lactoylglutathione lyase family enzyme
MRPILGALFLLTLSLTANELGTAATDRETRPQLQTKEHHMKVGHVHFGVKDLPGALQWMDTVWQLRPVYRDERMAILPFGEFSIIFDASSSDTSATVGFASQNCDDDVRAVKARGGVVLEEPSDRPWGVRAAYIQGPGALKFEIEQMLPRAKDGAR